MEGNQPHATENKHREQTQLVGRGGAFSKPSGAVAELAYLVSPCCWRGWRSSPRDRLRVHLPFRSSARECATVALGGMDGGRAVCCVMCCVIVPGLAWVSLVSCVVCGRARVWHLRSRVLPVLVVGVAALVTPTTATRHTSRERLNISLLLWWQHQPTPKLLYDRGPEI